MLTILNWLYIPGLFMDLGRFAVHRRLLAALYFIVTRGALPIGLSVLMGLLIYQSLNIQGKRFEWVFWLLFWLSVSYAVWAHVISLTFHVLSPVNFGKFSLGRLQTIGSSGGKFPHTVTEFVLLPSNAKMRIDIHKLAPVFGTVGETYLLLAHPTDNSVALPVMDGDARFMRYLLRFATKERRQDILREVQKLRAQTNVAPPAGTTAPKIAMAGQSA
jgi:hypothetical protein